jgi:hypothetical protein
MRATKLANAALEWRLGRFFGYLAQDQSAPYENSARSRHIWKAARDFGIDPFMVAQYLRHVHHESAAVVIKEIFLEEIKVLGEKGEKIPEVVLRMEKMMFE